MSDHAAPPAQPAAPTSAPPAAPAPETHNHLGRRLAFAASLALLVVAAVFVWRLLIDRPGWVSTDDAYLRADVTPLSAKVEGYVQAMPVVDNQRVKAGQLLLQIRQDDYQAQLEQALANQEAAEAAVADYEQQKAVQRAQIAQAEATLSGTQADLTRYKLEAERQQQLMRTGIAGTRQTNEQATANYLHTQATIEQNRAALTQQQEQLKRLGTQQAQAIATAKAQAALAKLAQINLAYTSIVAPSDGTIGERTVKPGQFVRDGTQVLTLVPAPDIWVVANFKETQLTDVRVGDKAEVRVDSFPDARLSGHVESLSPASGAQFALLPPDNSTGNFTKIVQRIPVKIVLDPEPTLAGLLRPGMSVEAEIEAGSAAKAQPRQGVAGK